MKLLLIGMLMGIADLIPGISGGTVAFLLGIYDDLLESLKTYRLRFLAPLGLGMALSLFTLAHVIRPLLQTPLLFAFFFGLIAASFLTALSREPPRKKREWIFLLLGALAAFLISGMGAAEATQSGSIRLFFSGMLAAGVMLLPGISGSFLLCLLGVYPQVIIALTEGKLSTLLPLALGIVCGLALFSRLIRGLLTVCRSLTIVFFLGMMVGGLRAVWPGLSLGSILVGIGGFLFVILLELSLSRKRFQDYS